MRRFIVVLVLPLIFVFSCEPCGKGYNPRRKISGFRITASDSTAKYLDQDSVFIQRDTAFFRIQFEVIPIAAASHSFEFISSATACSLVEPYLIYTIDSISVVTVDAWDANHPALSDISEYVTSKKQWGTLGSVDTTFSQYKGSVKSDRWFYLGTNWFGIHTLPISRKGRFYVWFRLSNGAVFKSNELKLVD